MKSIEQLYDKAFKKAHETTWDYVIANSSNGVWNKVYMSTYARIAWNVQIFVWSNISNEVENVVLTDDFTEEQIVNAYEKFI